MSVPSRESELGMVSATTMGGFIHVLLVAAVALAVVRITASRRPEAGP